MASMGPEAAPPATTPPPILSMNPSPCSTSEYDHYEHRPQAWLSPSELETHSFDEVITELGNLSSTPTTPLSFPAKSSFSESDIPRLRLTHQDQIAYWKNARGLPAAGGKLIFIPQRMYKPYTTDDFKRYVEKVFLDPPIYFWMDSPEECGISLSDSLHGRTKRLQNRDKEVFEGRGPSASIRLEWPGYRQWSRHIPTKDFKSPPRPISMRKLCKDVAKCVQRFIAERQNCELEDNTDSVWKAGNSGIQFEDLVLVSLHHVSMGSWQPQLRLRKA